MTTRLHWKRGAFSSTYRILSGDQEIGSLRDQTFKQKSDGEIHGERYRFQTQGLFKQHTQIMDLEKQEVIGNIRYNSWMTKAEITIRDRPYHWKYENVWQTRWTLTDDQKKILLSFSGGMTKGSIEGDDPGDLLVLIGLFVTNYYTQGGIAIFVAVFVPIWITMLNH